MGIDEPITVEINAQFNPTLDESPSPKTKKRWEMKLNKRQGVPRKSTIGDSRASSPEMIEKEIYRKFIAGDKETTPLFELQSKRGKSLINFYKKQKDWYSGRESLKDRQSQYGVKKEEGRLSKFWQEQSEINEHHKINTGQCKINDLTVPCFRDKISMLSSKSERPKPFDQETSCFDPFSKNKQKLQQRLYTRLQSNELEMPGYRKQIESQR